MTEDIQPDILRRTQESLGKFIKKPVLSEKLLRKPPFRFLHDICTAAMKETGFLEDTLSGNDVKIELITDKEGKIAFLQKVIAAVETANDVKLGVKPTKIVAGHEPIKTNEFLQALAFALEKKMESKQLVKKPAKRSSNEKKDDDAVKRKNVSNKPSNKTSEQPPPQDQKKEEKKRRGYDQKIEKPDADKRKPSKERGKSKINEKPKKNAIEGTKDEVNVVQATIRQNEKETTINGEPDKDVQIDIEDSDSKQIRPLSAKHKRMSATNRPSPDTTLTAPQQQDIGQSSDAVDRVLGGVINDLPATPRSPSAATSPAPIPTDSSARKRSSIPNETSDSGVTATSPSQPADNGVVTPVLGSANIRKSPPKNASDNFTSSSPTQLKANVPTPSEVVINNNSESLVKDLPAAQRPRTAIRPPSARPASARPAAPRVRDRGQIQLQEEVLKPVGKVNLIVEQDALQDDEELVSVQTVQENDVAAEDPSVPFPITTDTAEHGQLVNQILEAQKELEEDSFAKKGAGNRTEIEWSTGRGIEATRRDVDKIKVSVQALTRSANPLGKLLEYLQDDVDSMQQELQEWRDRNYSLSVKMEREKSLTDQSIEPLKAHLIELDESIRTEMEQIGALKAAILRNDDRINRMLISL